MLSQALALQLIAVILLWAAVMAQGAASRSIFDVVPLYRETKKACKPGCTRLGNCNFEDGRCECPYGLSGEECEIDKLSACRSSPEGFPSCGRVVPKNCKCYKQCMDVYCPNFRPGEFFSRCTHGMAIDVAACYTMKDTQYSQQYSDVPDNLENNTEWFKALPEANKQSAATLKLNVTDYGKTQHNRRMLPLSACPARCHDNGLCLTTEDFPADKTRTAVCLCKKGFKGKDCSEREQETCFFDPSCGGHGTCLSGFCKCDEGYFGLSCTRSHAWESAVATAPGTPLPVFARTRLRIYMYELPWDITFAAEYDDGHDIFGRDPNYTAYEYFVRYLLNDWVVRTENPLEANLFYVPMFNHFYWGPTGDPSVRIAYVLKYIQDKYPYWNRTGGADHFYWVSGDRGSCPMPRALQDQAIKVVHFGMQQRNIAWPNVPNKEYACIQIHRDVVAPPVQLHGLIQHLDMVKPRVEDYYKALVESKGREERRLLLFFAGGIAQGKYYSGGARQALDHVIKENKEEDVRVVEGRVDGYLQVLRTSKFCFAPYGYGFGQRIAQAMQHGCIPVVVQDFVYQPLESILPYEEFSVRIGHKDVQRIVPILRAFNEEDLAARRLKMAEVYRAFIWPQEYGGEAYNYTLRALHLRLRHHQSELFRH